MARTVGTLNGPRLPGIYEKLTAFFWCLWCDLSKSEHRAVVQTLVLSRGPLFGLSGPQDGGGDKRRLNSVGRGGRGELGLQVPLHALARPRPLAERGSCDNWIFHAFPNEPIKIQPIWFADTNFAFKNL